MEMGENTSILVAETVEGIWIKAPAVFGCLESLPEIFREKAFWGKQRAFLVPLFGLDLDFAEARNVFKRRIYCIDPPLRFTLLRAVLKN